MKAADAHRRRGLDEVVDAVAGWRVSEVPQSDFRTVTGDSIVAVGLFDAFHFPGEKSLLQVALEAEMRVDQKVGSVETLEFALKSSLPL